jgi:hypothetical protein
MRPVVHPHRQAARKRILIPSADEPSGRCAPKR